MPNVHIIAGPNGAGKTTFAREFLPNYANCLNFVNADLIAEGVAPLAPERAGVRAGRLMIEEINRHSSTKVDFGFETTFAGRGHLQTLQQLKQLRYRVHVYFLWLVSPELALQRVKERVARGGHDVAESVVRRRYKRSLTNFLEAYRYLADEWIIFDNSFASPHVVAKGEGETTEIIEREGYNELTKRLGKA